MWAEFEWENKVAINTGITDVDAFLAHIIATTNMKCLTPINPSDSESGGGGEAGKSLPPRRQPSSTALTFSSPHLPVAPSFGIPPLAPLFGHLRQSGSHISTPLPPLSGVCGYLAANLYAKSVFGEDALVNVSVEKQGDGKLAGYIRIRSKTQGIALSLGDKITLKQKGP